MANPPKSMVNAKEALDRVSELVNKLPGDPQAAARGYGHLLRIYEVNRIIEAVKSKL